MNWNTNIEWKDVVRYFDKLEDRVRARLSHRSFLYAFIAGIGTVLFWRGVWHICDRLENKDVLVDWSSLQTIIFSGPGTMIIGAIMLLMTGLFVSNLMGERIIISGLKQEKKEADKTLAEIQEEEAKTQSLQRKLDEMKKEIDEIKHTVVDHICDVPDIKK